MAVSDRQDRGADDRSHPSDDDAPAAHPAPGAPGEPARWTWGGKSGVGTALGTASSVWFTLSHGIITEVYYPALDTASVRDVQLLVADGRDFFAEEQHNTRCEIRYAAPGVPIYRLVNTCTAGGFRIEKEVLADPRRSVVLQETRFIAQHGGLAEYCVCAILNPHLGNAGMGNNAWVGDYKGIPMLFARRAGFALALACTAPWKQRSAGFVGVSDGWQDLTRHHRMTWTYDRAENGNVGLTGEIDLEACDGQFILALAFGRDDAEAGHRARASLMQGYAAARERYIRSWSELHHSLLQLPAAHEHREDLYRISAMVMRVHEAKNFPGAVIASLAVPWGEARGDLDMGYHLVWPRDMVNTVGGLLAIREHEHARRVLFYLDVTQEADGHWPQNMFLDGRPSWTGVQLDETAFVILLVGMAHRHQALGDADLKFLWPMVSKAAGYLVRHGPLTPMDRWEETPGYYVSTIAVEVPALLVAAEVAETQGEAEMAVFLRETADAWNDAIDRLLYVRGTDLARATGVDGYYVRFARSDQMQLPGPAHGTVTIPNHSPDEREYPASAIISPDALQLVRFGLRAADDPRIVNTVKVIDRTCKVETPRGPCWHRYTHDGYGEHADGSPFDGTGIGRGWPLLVGERGHYELTAGRPNEADRLLHVMESFAGDCGLFPEQVWDTADIPQKELCCGRPSGSAMPLVWAHAEYVKLRRSLHDGRVFDLPEVTVERYLRRATTGRHVCWKPEQRWHAMPPGKVLRLELPTAGEVPWSADGWQTHQTVPTGDTGLGLHIADLPTERLPEGARIALRVRAADDGESDRDRATYEVAVG
jgi:glucoamylase